MPNNTHDIALAVVRKFAPDEEPAFDMIWEESGGASGTLRDAPGQFGLDPVTAPLFAAVIIPIVVEFGKRLADDSADNIVGWVRQHLGMHRRTEAGILTDEKRLIPLSQVHQHIGGGGRNLKRGWVSSFRVP